MFAIPAKVHNVHKSTSNYHVKTYPCNIYVQYDSSKIYCLSRVVPDKRSRILEVVFVRRLVTWVRGIWSGEGMGKG